MNRRGAITEGVDTFLGIGLSFGGGFSFSKLVDEDDPGSGFAAAGPSKEGAETAEAPVEDLEHFRTRSRKA